MNESEIPIPVPSTDEAWKAMLKKLEQDDQNPVPVVGARKNPIGRIIAAVALLLLILLAGWFMLDGSWIGNDKRTSEQVSGSNADQNSNKPANELSKADNKNLNNSSGIKDNDSSQDASDSNLREDKVVSTNGKPVTKEHAQKIKSRNNPVSNRNSSKNSLANKKRKNESGSNALNRANSDPLSSSGEDDLKYSSVYYALLSAGSIHKPLFPKMKIHRAAEQPEPVQNSYWLMEAGLEWNLPIPFSSARNLLDGPNGDLQPYRILLPGAWLRLEAGKHSMSLGLNPFYTALLPNTPFEVFDSVATSADTTRSYIETRTLNKTFGLSAAFEYNYNLTDRFWIGAGIQTTVWGNGLVGLNGEVRKLPLNGSPMIISPYQSERSINEEEWNNFSKTQIGLTGQFFYRNKPWDAGFRLSLPITPLAKQNGPSNPFRAEFLFRIKLIDWRIRQ